jgi:hypothetical protein
MDFYISVKPDQRIPLRDWDEIANRIEKYLKTEYPGDNLKTKIEESEKPEEFEAWFERYFACTQGEDSPYSYEDIRSAFNAGWELRAKKKP